MPSTTVTLTNKSSSPQGGILLLFQPGGAYTNEGTLNVKVLPSDPEFAAWDALALGAQYVLSVEPKQPEGA
jgi:hypothetical protein